MRQIFILWLFILGGSLMAQNIDYTAIEEAYNSENVELSGSLLTSALESAESDLERGRIYALLSRNQYRIGFLKEVDGSKDKNALIAVYSQGEQYGNRAMELAPGNSQGYIWTAVNIGLAATQRGILDSLNKAEPMRQILMKGTIIAPRLPDYYFVLGQMYEQLPNGIKFGDKNRAVSLGRYCVYLQELELQKGLRLKQDIRYDFIFHHARHLWYRNWSEKKRNKMQKELQIQKSGSLSAFESALVYEAGINLTNQSDRDEARDIIAKVVKDLQAIPSRDIDQQEYLKEALGYQKKWR